MRIGAETGIMQPQAKEPKGAAAIRSDKRSTEGILYPFPKWSNSADILLREPWLQSCKTTHFSCIKLSILWQRVRAALGKAFGDLAGQSIQSTFPSVLSSPLTLCSGLQFLHTYVVLWFCSHTCCSPAWKLLRLSSWWNCNSSFNTQIRGQTPRKKSLISQTERVAAP